MRSLLLAVCLLIPAVASAQDAAANPCDQPEASVQLSFDLYQGRLTPEGVATVERLAAVLQRCPDVAFELQVHTDTVRMTSFNVRQSQRVADHVREVLASRGVAASRLAACGYGESRPLPDVRPSMRGTRNERLVVRRLAGAASAHRCPTP